MKLYYANKYHSYASFNNFGDCLNELVWNTILPGIFSEGDSDIAFIGFGTLLNGHLPKFRKTIIFGTGYGYGRAPRIDKSWHIYCVRGPITAKALNIPFELGIADSSILVRKLINYSISKRHKVSLIPHVFEMHEKPDVFNKAAQNLGWFCIDPRWSVDKILNEIASTELIVTSAMHGAIIADAFRVQWVPIKSNAGIPNIKWQDFFASMCIKFKFPRLYRFSSVFNKIPNSTNIEAAYLSSRLNELVKAQLPFLSNDNLLNHKITQLEERIGQFKIDFATGLFD